MCIRDRFSIDETDINYFNKDFAIAYDRQICLRDGEYEYVIGGLAIQPASGSTYQMNFHVNGANVGKAFNNSVLWSKTSTSGIIHLKRGDYVQVLGGYWSDTDSEHAIYYIRRLK